MLKRNIIFLFIILFLSPLFAELKVYFANVGQGDGTVIVTPSGKVVVFDINSSHGGTILKILNDNGFNTQIDYLLASHYHADHVGGISGLINGVTPYPGVDVINACYDRGGSYHTATFNNYLNAVNITTGGRKSVVLGSIIDFLDGTVIQFLTENARVFDNGGSISTTDENNLSVSIVLRYRNFDCFIGGDLGSAIENLLANKIDEVDVYRVNHHGSRNNSSQSFLDSILPTVSIISVGNGNTYGHPHQDALNRLNGVGSYIYQTERGSSDGGVLYEGWGKIAEDTVLLTTDGCIYNISFNTVIDTYYTKISCTPDTDPPVFSGLKNALDTEKSGEIYINWDAATDVSTPIKYNIYRSNISMDYDFDVFHHSTYKLNFTDTDLVNGTTYYYMVRAQDRQGNEDSNTVEKYSVPSDSTPPIFAGLNKIEATGGDLECILFWSSATDVSHPISYNIYRSTATMNYRFSNPLNTTTDNFFVDILPNDSRYYYIVRAMDKYDNEEKNTVERSIRLLTDGKPDLYIYPNPAAANVVNFETTSPIYSISVFDIAGREIYYEYFIKPDTKIINYDISNLSSGIYIVSVKLSNGITAISKFARTR